MSNGVAEGKSPLCYLTQLRKLYLLPLFYVTSCHVVHKYSNNAHKMKSSLVINNIFLHFFLNVCNLFNNALVSSGDNRNASMSLRNTFNFRFCYFLINLNKSMQNLCPLLTTILFVLTRVWNSFEGYQEAFHLYNRV